MTMSKLDFPQVIKSQAVELADGSLAQQIISSGGVLVPDQFDEMDLTYVTVGNGIGEIETIVYSLSASPIATLTLSYDVNNRLSNVVRS